jgi:hypothetical protein
VEHTPGLCPVGGVEPHPVQDVVHVVDSTATDTFERTSARFPDLLVRDELTIRTEQVTRQVVPVGDPEAETINDLTVVHVPVIDVGDVGFLERGVVGDPRPRNPSCSRLSREEESENDRAESGDKTRRDRNHLQKNIFVDCFFGI